MDSIQHFLVSKCCCVYLAVHTCFLWQPWGGSMAAGIPFLQMRKWSSESFKWLWSHMRPLNSRFSFLFRIPKDTKHLHMVVFFYCLWCFLCVLTHFILTIALRVSQYQFFWYYYDSQAERCRHRVTERLGHAARESQSWNLNPGSRLSPLCHTTAKCTDILMLSELREMCP